MKIHNVFISALGSDIQYYSALVRSLDSSLGNMLEDMAINIAKLFYEVNKSVEGELYPEQTSKIAELLEGYKNTKNPLMPDLSHYEEIRKIKPGSKVITKRHVSDYYLIDRETNSHHLIELKIGGDLDNKKARSEKEAIFEQYAILANSLRNKNATIKCHFATAYNRFGEDKEWKQGRVLQFFSKDELLIGKDFWNFVCKSNDGYDLVLETYRNIFADMRFQRNMVEMSLWNRLNQYAI
ncbi:MAG: TdeIII family type II restriction endonuclease [Candidatus Magasanikbacteria bacterium CG_4_10_14_0_2_um_filter_37_12]|uniref:type II site-specific deoxyribonuclease n=1 Tax=Candidatus Magasanikbacteria bacterium CG_4_10_14_0_2_um_filter_37_12 TaxID=1974637 RepID=A0A2M7V799_9BACT|nr:MAG: TdeIII family type II restriction endonuclease [Candidatus Magasanikbacteria bacterium CG_4_10_14_0_2_um_filter_37_12]